MKKAEFGSRSLCNPVPTVSHLNYESSCGHKLYNMEKEGLKILVCIKSAIQ